MSKLSVYGGTGFVGGNFSRMYPDDTIVIPREQREPESDEILYFISTVDNYNVHTNITLDVETNLKVLCETLDKCRDCLLYTSPSPRDATLSRMPSSA